MARRRVTLDEHRKLTAPTGLSALGGQEEEREPEETQAPPAPAPAPARPKADPVRRPTARTLYASKGLTNVEPAEPAEYTLQREKQEKTEKTQTKRVGVSEAMRNRVTPMLYSRKFIEQTIRPQAPDRQFETRANLDAYYQDVIDQFLASPDPDPQGAPDVWEAPPAVSRHPGAPVDPRAYAQMLERQSVPRIRPHIPYILKMWAGAKMGKNYEDTDTAFANFPADYAEYRRDKPVAEDRWARTPKDSTIVASLPNGEVNIIHRSESAEENRAISNYMDAGPGRTTLLDTIPEEDHLAAMSIHSEEDGVTEDFMRGVLGDEAAANSLAESAYAANARLVYAHGRPMVPILYSDEGVPSIAIRDVYNRLWIAKTRDSLVRQGIDWRGQTWDELKAKHSPKLINDAAREGHDYARLWWERNVHQNDAPVVYLDAFDSEEQLKAEAEDQSWREDAPIKGGLSGLASAYFHSPSYKATYVPDRPAMAARYRDFPLEDVEAARTLESGWQAAGRPGVGRFVDEAIRAGSVTQQLGAALSLAKEEADRKDAAGDEDAMRTDKIFKRAYEFWNTPEHVQRIIRTEDGTGYLIHELGNYVGGRALYGLDDLGTTGDVVSIGGSVMPASAVGVIGTKGILYLLGFDVNVLPRYTEDVAYKDRGAVGNTVGYLHGLIDETPGWSAALVLDMVDLGQPLNTGLIGVGQVGKLSTLLVKEGIRVGVSESIPTASKVWLRVLEESSPGDTLDTLLARARELDPTLTGDVEQQLATALLDRMGDGDVIEGNMESLNKVIRGLQQAEGDLGGKISKALKEAEEAVDTETEIAGLSKIIKEGESRSKALTEEIAAQEKLRKQLDRSRVDVEPEGAEAPVATQKAVDKVRKEIDKLVVEMDSLRSEGKDITAVQNKLRKKGEQFDEMNTSLRAQELEAGAQVSKEAAEALSKEAEGVAVEGVDAAADVARLEGEIADLARQRDALKAKPAKEVVEEVVEEAAPPARDPHQQDLHWDGPVPKGSTPEERIRPLMERLRAEQKKHGPYDDDIHFRAFPWKSIDGMAQLRKDIDELSKREPKVSKHQRDLRDVEGWIEQEHGRGRTPLPDTAPQVVEPIAAFVDDFFKKYPSPTKKAPKKAPKKTAKPDKALAGVEAKIVAAEKELVAARKAAEAAPKAAPAKEVAEAVVKEEPARVVLLDEIRAAVPEKAPDGRPIQFGDGPFSDINRAIYVSATQPSTKIGRTAIAWLESIGITRADQKVYRALMRKEVATAPKAFSSITVIGAKNLKDNIENFFLSRKGNRSAVKQRQRLKSFLAPPKKPKAPPKAAKAKKEPLPKIAVTAQNIAKLMAESQEFRNKVNTAAKKRLATRKRTDTYFKRVLASSNKLAKALKTAGATPTKKNKALAIRAQKELAGSIGDKSTFMLHMLSRQTDTISKIKVRLDRELAQARLARTVAEKARQRLGPELLEGLLTRGGRRLKEPLDLAAARTQKDMDKDVAALQSAAEILAKPVRAAEVSGEVAQSLLSNIRGSIERVAKIGLTVETYGSDPKLVDELNRLTRTGHEIADHSAKGNVRGALMALARDNEEAIPSVARFLGMTDDQIEAAAKAGTLKSEVATGFAIRERLIAQWTENAPPNAGPLLVPKRDPAGFMLRMRKAPSKRLWGAYAARAWQNMFSPERPWLRSHRFLEGMGEDIGLLADRIYRRSRVQYSDLQHIAERNLPIIRGLKEGGRIDATPLYTHLVDYVSSNDPVVLESILKRLADAKGIRDIATEGSAVRAAFGVDSRFYGGTQEGSTLLEDAFFAFKTIAEKAREIDPDMKAVPRDIEGLRLFLGSLLRVEGATAKEQLNDVAREFLRTLLDEKQMGKLHRAHPDSGYKVLIDAVESATIKVRDARISGQQPTFISPLVRDKAGDLNFIALLESVQVIARTSLEIDALIRTVKVAGGMYSRSNQQALVAHFNGPEAVAKFIKARDFVPNDVVVLKKDAIALEDFAEASRKLLREGFVKGRGKELFSPMLDKQFTRSYFIDSIDKAAGTAKVIDTTNPGKVLDVKLSGIAYRPPAFSSLDLFDATRAYGFSFKGTAEGASLEMKTAANASHQAKRSLLNYINLGIGPNGTSIPVLTGVRDEALNAVQNSYRGLGGTVKRRLAGDTSVQDKISQKFLLDGVMDYWKVGILFGWTALSIRPDRPFEIFFDDTLNTLISPGAGEKASLLETVAFASGMLLYGTLGQVPIIREGLTEAASKAAQKVAGKTGKTSLPPMVGVFADPHLNEIMAGRVGGKLNVAEGTISYRQAVKEMIEDGVDDNIRSEDKLAHLLGDLELEPTATYRPTRPWAVPGVSKLGGGVPQEKVSAWQSPSFRGDIAETVTFMKDSAVPRGIEKRVWNGVKTVVKGTVGPRNVAIQAMDRFIRTVTMRQRAQLYLNLRTIKKVPRDEARKIMLEALYDWDLIATSWFEKEILKRALPWYTWQKNLVMQMGKVLFEPGTMSGGELASRWMTGRTRAQRLALAHRLRANMQYEKGDRPLTDEETAALMYEMQMPGYYDKYGIFTAYTIDYEGRRRGPYEQRNWGYSGPLAGTLEGYEAGASIAYQIAIMTGVIHSGADTVAMRNQSPVSLIQSFTEDTIDQFVPLTKRRLEAALGIADPDWGLTGRDVRLNKDAYISLQGFPWYQDANMRVVEKEGEAPYVVWRVPESTNEKMVRGLALDVNSFIVGNTKEQYSKNLEMIPGGRAAVKKLPLIGHFMGIDRDPQMNAILASIEASGGDVEAYLLAMAELKGFVNILKWDGEAALLKDTGRKMRGASQEAKSLEEIMEARTVKAFGEEPTDVTTEAERSKKLFDQQSPEDKERLRKLYQLP